MKVPENPPDSNRTLLTLAKDISRLTRVMALSSNERMARHYLHWDKLKHYPPPPGVTSEEWWLALKVGRRGILKEIPLKDKAGRGFQFCVPDVVAEQLHRIDCGAGAN